jgi:histidyl-tRNA synthetase
MVLYKAPRGTFDILPQDHAYWKFVKEKAVEICRLYGYQPLSTPVFEDARLFTRAIVQGTDIVDKEMYVFKDRSGQELALRAEGTAPVCRAYIEHGLFNLPQPVKLYYFASAFRYERPQAGRFRQHHQFGFEALGEADPALDAEVIEMAQRFFLSLGLSDFSIQINSIGCRSCRPGYLELLKQHYAKYRNHLCSDCQSRLARNPLRLLDCKRASCQQIAQSAPQIALYLCSQCQLHFQNVQRYLTVLNIPFELNHRLVRGLDYYTRTVFEVEPRETTGQGTLGGGGRYDNLIEDLGGKPTPGVGFATGLERIILNLKKQEVKIPESPKPMAFIAWVGEAAKIQGLRLASSLRAAQLSVIMGTGDKSLKTQLRHADSLGVSYVVIIGEKELADNSVVLREMKYGTQKTLPLGQLIQILKESRI